MPTALFTIVAKNYLAQARALMESAANLSPDAERFAVLVDEPEGRFDPAAEPFEVVPCGDLSVQDLPALRFRYSLVELSTALKPHSAQYLFDRGFDRVVYLDPDILLYQPLDRIFTELDSADVLLTPHLTEPLDDGCRPDEQDILRAGTYNLGFLALKRSQPAADLLEWWRRRLEHLCIADPEQGLYVDQRWMDLAPGLFPRVRVVRDPGWNVAYWNLASRPVRIGSEGPTAAGRPLVFFHFSGFDPLQPGAFVESQSRFLASEIGDAARLVEQYRETLLRHGYADCSEWPYTWASFADGDPIPDDLRVRFRDDPALAASVDDPFSASGRSALAAADRPLDPDWLQALSAGIPGFRRRMAAEISGPDLHVRIERHLAAPDQETGLPRLARLLLAARPDLERRYGPPDARAASYLAWLLTYGAAEYRLPRGLLGSLEGSWSKALARLSPREAAKMRLRRAALSFGARRARPAPL